MSNSQTLTQIQESIKIKRDLIDSLTKSLKLIKSSLNDDIKYHQSICNHEYVAEREPYDRTIYRCKLCGKL
jgi:hypothetical protein